METQARKKIEERFSGQGEGARWDEMYSRPKTTFEMHMMRRRDLTQAFIKKAFPAKDAKILDLGCGAGVLSEALFQAGYATECVDASADMLALTRKRLARFPNFKNEFLHQADILALPFPDGTFDVVGCLGVFGYFRESVQALKEIKRVMKPGGILILSVRNFYHTLITDPLLFLKEKFFPVHKPVSLTETATKAPAPSNSGPSREFVIDMYERPGYLQAGVATIGLRPGELIGYGMGPFTLLGKPVLPETVSKGLSRIISGIGAVWPLSYLGGRIFDVSIYVIRKPDGK